jgi:RimJ/RimL family protein N-acetyltransferase
MTPSDPEDGLVPALTRPLLARTHLGEVVRLRDLRAGEPRVDSSSPWDDWGTFDVIVDEAAHRRAMIEVPADDSLDLDVTIWQPVGDMSWHADFYGPNRGSRSINIGISLAGAERGRGIGAVAQSLLAWAMHDSGVFRVEAQSDAANTGEHLSLLRAGFSREGVLRGAQWRADGRHDLVSFSCLPGEPRIIPMRYPIPE